MSWQRIHIPWLALATWSAPAGARLVDTVESKHLSTSDSGFVGVLISGNPGGVDSEPVVTRLGGPGLLRPGGTISNGPPGSPNDVFSGVSTPTPGSPYGTSSLTAYPDDTFVGGGGARLGSDGNPVSTPVHGPANPRLLARLQLAPDRVTPVSSFRISPSPLSGQGAVGDPTSFTTFDPGSVSDTAAPSVGTPGLVTFTFASSVPEPGSLGLAFTAILRARFA